MNKLFACTRACAFLGFPLDASGWLFYDPVTHQFFASQDVSFDESVSYYRSRPHRGPEAFSPPLFLTLEPPPVAPPPLRPARSGVSHVTPQSSPPQRPVPVVYGGAGGAVAEGEGTGAAGARGASSGGARGVRVETTLEEDMAVSTQRPCPASPPGFPGVPTGGTGVPGGVVGGGSGCEGAGAGDTSTVMPTPCTVRFLTRVQRLYRLEREEQERFERARQQQEQQTQSERQERVEEESRQQQQQQHQHRAVSPEPRWSRYCADDLFRLVLRSCVPPPHVLPQPPESSLTVFHDPLSDYLRASRPVVSRVLSTLVTHPTAPLSSVSELVTTVAGFASSHRFDYTAHLVSDPAHSPFSRGAPVFPLEVLEDRPFELGFLAAIVPHLCAMLLAPEGDPDALDIPIPCNHIEAVSGPWASYWIAAEEAEMSSYRSIGTYVNAVSPPGANVVSGMWFYEVKRLPGAPPVFKARYVARGLTDYDLHSLDFPAAFLQGSLHELIWLRRPLGFTGSFPPGTQWQLCRLVYGLRQAPREWHDTLRVTLAALDFFPSYADPSLFVCRGSTMFVVLVYVDDLVFATLDRHALASVKEEQQRRHTCTNLGELQCYLGLQITRDRAARTITLTQSHGRADPHAPFESSGPYPELVGCLMYLMTCTHPDLAYPLSVLACFVAPGRHQPSHWYAAKRVAKYVASTSGMRLVLGGKQPATLKGYSDSSWADDAESLRSTQGYCFSLGTGAVSWRSTRASSVSSSSCEAEVYAAAMAAQELCWLSFLLTDLGERPCSPPVLFANNRSTVLLCEEPRLVGKAKHIQLRYFLLREFQHGQARVVRVVSEANTADIFTKVLPPCAHQRFCTQLGLVSTGPHLLA
ncbi:unnamed protein product [Closterium sp. NIES-54]